MSTTEELIKKIVADQLGIPASTVRNEDSFVADLGADSLDTIELVMQVENEFGIEIPDDEAEKITTVQQAIDYIAKRTASMSTQDKAADRMRLAALYNDGWSDKETGAAYRPGEALDEWLASTQQAALAELTADAEALGLYEASTQQAEPNADREARRAAQEENANLKAALASVQNRIAQAVARAGMTLIVKQGGQYEVVKLGEIKAQQAEPAQAAAPTLYQVMAAAKAIHATTPGADDWGALRQCEVDVLRARAEKVLLAAQPKEPVQPAEAVVAWLHQCRKKPELRELSFEKSRPDLASMGYVAKPLVHTAPAQAPLTRSEIDDLAGPGPDYFDRHVFAAAIQSACAAAWGVKLEEQAR